MNNQPYSHNTPIRFLDLRITSPDEILHMQNSLQTIAEHGQIINSPEVEKFEYVAKKYLGCEYTLGVGSGTDALIAALLALEIGPGDEVILPCLSFVGSASAVSMVGATPIFADIDSNLCINPKEILPLITAKTKAIMPVHFTGLLAPMNEILQIAQTYNLKIIEDAAPSFGAELQGKKAGTFADIGCFSMNPMKVLGAWGEAGLLATNSEKIYNRLKQLRYHNIPDKELCYGRGVNARLDAIQAASLIYRLKFLDKNIQHRRKIAHELNKHLQKYVQTQSQNHISDQHVYYTYSILTPERDALKDYLTQCGIETKIYHRYLMPRHPAYITHHQHQQKFPVGDIATQQILCLPIHEKIQDYEVGRVIDAVQQYFKGRI